MSLVEASLLDSCIILRIFVDNFERGGRLLVEECMLLVLGRAVLTLMERMSRQPRTSGASLLLQQLRTYAVH